MDTQVQKHPGGWTKADGIQPVRDTQVVEVIFGSMAPIQDVSDHGRLLAREVNWSYQQLWWRKAN